jgi:uncharacterized protein
MIIDTHTHWPLGKVPEAEGFLRMMDRFGIDISIVSGLEILHKFDTAQKWNDLMVDFCRKSGGRLLPFGTVHLAEGEKACLEAERCLTKLGVKGFKFHPWVQGEYILRNEMYEICKLAAKAGVPLMFHDGTPVYSMPSQIGVLAQMHPKTTFILGHGGILYFWKEAIEVTRQNPNVIITLCGQHPLAMQTICDEIDSDRILFGTDFTGPGMEELVAYRKGMVDRLDMDEDKRMKIMGKNALRILNINT